MSELVNRIRILERKILELEDKVAEERKRYVSEVDHSEDMAFILSGLGSQVSSEYDDAIVSILERHQERRRNDEDLPILSRSTQEVD
jgi:hypothetical protein